MIRSIIVLCLLANTLTAQDPNTTLPADCKCQCNCAERLAKLEARIAALEGKKAAALESKVVVECLVDDYGNSTCKFCEAWWNGPDPAALRQQGWKVEKALIVGGVPGKFYPRWRVCVGDSCTFIEYTKDFLGELRKRVK